MTAVPAPLHAAAAAPSTAATIELGRLEARRALRSVPFWVGLAATGLYFTQATGGGEWQAQTYQLVGTVAFGPVCAGIFIAAVMAASRDHVAELPLAEEAALGADRRAVAHLVGVLAHVLVLVLVVAALAVVTRVEGGLWIGDAETRIDDALHSPAELLQPILAGAFAGALGVAIGRATRLRVAAAVTGGLVWLLGSVVYWAWQGAPLRYLTALQAQPIEVDLPPGTLPADVPGLQLSAPDQYQEVWRWVVVDQAMAAWHDLYLVALVIVFGGLAVRGRTGRAVAAIGGLLAIGAVVLQIRSVPVPPR